MAHVHLAVRLLVTADAFVGAEFAVIAEPLVGCLRRNEGDTELLYTILKEGLQRLLLKHTAIERTLVNCGGAEVLASLMWVGGADFQRLVISQLAALSTVNESVHQTITGLVDGDPFARLVDCARNGDDAVKHTMIKHLAKLTVASTSAWKSAVEAGGVLILAVIVREEQEDVQLVEAAMDVLVHVCNNVSDQVDRVRKTMEETGTVPRVVAELRSEFPSLRLRTAHVLECLARHEVSYRAILAADGKVALKEAAKQHQEDPDSPFRTRVDRALEANVCDQMRSTPLGHPNCGGCDLSRDFVSHLLEVGQDRRFGIRCRRWARPVRFHPGSSESW